MSAACLRIRHLRAACPLPARPTLPAPPPSPPPACACSNTISTYVCTYTRSPTLAHTLTPIDHTGLSTRTPLIYRLPRGAWCVLPRAHWPPTRDCLAPCTPPACLSACRPAATHSLPPSLAPSDASILRHDPTVTPSASLPACHCAAPTPATCQRPEAVCVSTPWWVQDWEAAACIAC